MDLDTTRTIDAITPITRRSDADEVGRAAYDRLLGLLGQLGPDQWRAPTECTGWDVAAMVGHVIGAARSNASFRELLRQQAWGTRHRREFDGNALDATNALQVRDHAALSPDERLATLRRVAPAAVRGRGRLPGPLRGVAIPLDQSGSTAPGMPARLRLGHLVDVIYSRDTWLHTVDIARAVDQPFVADHAVDRRIVEDVVAEWAGRHGQPVDLHLTGPAGGRFRTTEPGPSVTLDAVAFCRVLSGRAEPEEVVDGAAGRELLRTRVLF